jgi:hypothetical protein
MLTLTGLPTLPEANFTVSATSIIAGSSVQFTDHSTLYSTNATLYNWDFGNGQSSTEQNPTHTYTTPGVYTVTLIASNDAGYSTATATIYVQQTAGYFNDSISSVSGWWWLIVSFMFLTFLSFVAVVAILAIRNLQSGTLNVDIPTLVNLSIGFIVFVSIIIIGSFIIYLIVFYL